MSLQIPAPIFGTYEEAKTRIELQIKIPQAINRGKKRVSKMKTPNAPLMITKGKGEDEDESKEEESEKEEELVRK